MGKKGTPTCKPIDTRSRGEKWHDIRVQFAAFAAVKA
jgi:hypothetical protein